MARYSVYNYSSRLYDYYQDNATTETHAGAPPVIALSGVGETPEGAAWRVPADARKVGSGPLPMGRIASMGDLGTDLPRLGIMVGLAYLAWKVIKR